MKKGNEGREERGGGSGRKQSWVDRGGEREGGKQGEKKKKEGKVWKEGSSVLLKTGGQTVCNWLGPQGLKKRFKERREREIEGKLTDSGEKMKGRKRRKA